MNSVYFLPTEIDICGYVSIYYLTSAWIPLLPSDMRLPLFLGIPFFDTFLELLGSELPQQTPEFKSWDI